MPVLRPTTVLALLVAGCVGPSPEPAFEVSTDSRAYRSLVPNEILWVAVTVRNVGPDILTFGECAMTGIYSVDQLDRTTWHEVRSNDLPCGATVNLRALAPSEQFTFLVPVNFCCGQFRIRVPDNSYTGRPPTHIGRTATFGVS